MSKNEDILDAINKTGFRTCPECGYQFSLSLFVKRYVMKFGFPKWTCPKCHEYIKYNYTKSNLIGAISFIAFVFLFQFFQSKFGLNLSNFIFLIPYFIFILALLNFERFEKY